jgi:spermidine synthase
VRFKRFILASIAFLIAFCSLSYEFVLCQLLAGLKGNSVLRYSLTTGIYLAALGFGSLIHWLRPPQDPDGAFFRLELMLAVSGALVPLIILVSIPLMGLTDLFVYTWIVFIGMLSGLEIPILIQVGERYDAAAGVRLMAWDYIGTFAAAVAFPILFKVSGLIQMSLLIGLMNLGATALFMLVCHRSQPRLLQLLGASVVASAFIVALNYEPLIRKLFSRAIYGTL